VVLQALCSDPQVDAQNPIEHGPVTLHELAQPLGDRQQSPGCRGPQYFGDYRVISYLRGNLLEDDALALVNTVNTVGVMDKGIALQFKQRFPANDVAYAQACKLRQVHTGRMLVTVTEPGELTGPR
jgi:hypothetical protein